MNLFHNLAQSQLRSAQQHNCTLNVHTVSQWFGQGCFSFSRNISKLLPEHKTEFPSKTRSFVQSKAIIKFKDSKFYLAIEHREN